MPFFADLIAQGSTPAWLFIPSAILLGALHGLEPGLSKKMMAAITVLSLCFRLRDFTLLCTLVAVGATAALGVRHATRRWPWFSSAAHKAPYVSGVLIIPVGLYVGYHGWTGLAAQAATAVPATG